MTKGIDGVKVLQSRMKAPQRSISKKNKTGSKMDFMDNLSVYLIEQGFYNSVELFWKESAIDTTEKANQINK